MSRILAVWRGRGREGGEGGREGGDGGNERGGWQVLKFVKLLLEEEKIPVTIKNRPVLLLLAETSVGRTM